jgi:glutathione S-transferase
VAGRSRGAHAGAGDRGGDDAGFSALRQAMPMNLGIHRPGVGHTGGALADAKRIEAIWAETRARYGGGGPFLFGLTFTLADVMYAPVVARFISYQPDLSAESRAYCKAVRAHPLVSAWYDAAAAEPKEWLLEKYEKLA